MNVYLLGMCIMMAVLVIIAFVISKKLKGAEDFFVAGRKAPLFLIAGSMIASYASTGMFMGDAAQCYDGLLGPMILYFGMQCAGYIFGAVFFGRYLRRSKTLTVPEFFGKRFASKHMRLLSAITAIITMSVYLLSVLQGVGTLMSLVTELDYNVCLVISLFVFTFISIFSGSRGVLITDTLMACVFTLALIVAAIFIANSCGGWFEAIQNLASNPDTSSLLSGGGKPGVLYATAGENIVWAMTLGFVWCGVCMVAPWQTSRYQMAKNESTVVRSAFIAAFGVFVLEFMSGMSAVLIHTLHPEISSSSHILLWAAMNIMPKIVGIVLLTGVLCAGLSSATTFLSLIGASFANDILHKTDDKSAIRTGRIAMLIVGIIVCLVAVSNSPAIFIIMYLGAAMVGASWMPVAVASVFSKRLTKTGAFCGMLAGFIGCFGVKLFVYFAGISLPVYLDPPIIGAACNIIAMIIGSAATQVQDDERKQRLALFVVPKEERNLSTVSKTVRITKYSVIVGLSMAAIVLIFWAIPYLSAL